jgi:hypothetical protein
MHEEIQDIVDEDDNVVGKDTRENIWKKGLEHNVRTVNIFLFNQEGRLLIPRRSKNKKNWPMTYDFSCGENVVAGETYEDAAQRGIREELGIHGVILTNLGKLTPKDGIGCFAMTFQGNISGNLNSYNKDDFEGIYWMSIEEVGELLNKSPEKFKADYKETFEAFFKN